MAGQTPDVSFESGGRPLASWLLDLVSEEAPARLAAGEALQAMMFGEPEDDDEPGDVVEHSSRDIAERPDCFKGAMRTIVEAPGFPRADFVRRLIVYRIATKDDWHRRTREVFDRDQSPGAFEERLIRRIRAAGDDSAREEATRRYLRWLCASLARDCRRQEDIFSGAEAMTAAGLMAGVIFDALGPALLADRPGLSAMLQDEAMFHEAAGALAGIGPPARDFAGLLLDRLDAQEVPYRFEGAQALGSIGRDDPGVIDALLTRLRSGPGPVRIGAAQALGHAGPPLAGRLETALDLLLGATHTPDLIFAATTALASIGRDREEALRRVLELAAPRPPRWRTEPESPEYPFDEALHERGVAIGALDHFRRFAGRVVPALVDAFDTFDEFDPDWSYGGERARVCQSLLAFGAEAAPAVPRLVRYLEDWRLRPDSERPWPSDVFGLLASIGPAAAESLPALESLRAARAEEDEDLSPALDPEDALDRAILALRGD
jgi:hypothetical protein